MGSPIPSFNRQYIPTRRILSHTCTMSGHLHSPVLASKEASHWGNYVSIILLTKDGEVPIITPQEIATCAGKTYSY